MRNSTRLALAGTIAAVWYFFTEDRLLASTLIIMASILITGSYIVRELEKK